MSIVEGYSVVQSGGRLEWDENFGYCLWENGCTLPIAEMIKPFIGCHVQIDITSEDIGMISRRLGDINDGKERYSI